MDQILRSLAKNDNFQRVYIETDVDPEDDKTPGWTAGVLFSDELEPDGVGTFLGLFAETPVQALSLLVERLVEEEYAEKGLE